MRPEILTDRNLATGTDRRQLLCASLAVGALAATPAQPFAAAHGLALRTDLPPLLVPTGGGKRLVQEIHATNFAGSELTLEWLEIVDTDGRAMIERIEGADLSRLVSPSGKAPAIADWSAAVIYIDLLRHRFPARIAYRLGYQSRSGKAVVELAGQPVLQNGIRISPPLAGGPWGAIYDPGLERGHRRMIYAVAVKARIPGRFAVDWVALTGPGGAYDPNGGLGTPVLAVADGIVVALRDDFPDPEDPAADRDVATADASGNFVALDLGNGRFAFYEHLQRGLAIKAGARVRRGQQLGRLGATGQVMGAHLHFHIADRPSLLDAEGMPFVLDRGSNIGAFRSIGDFADSKPWARTAEVSAVGLFPTANSVLQFG